MGIGRSTETSRELAEERVVRTFLERAASVILESRTLDGPRFEAVVALAKEVGLTREQLSCELRFLELRGVITSAPWERLDVPDDVPRTRAEPAATAPEGVRERLPAAAAPAPATPATAEVLARFREVVEQRVTRYGSLTSKARQTLEVDGAALGLTPHQIAATVSAIAARHVPTAVPSEAPAAADTGLPAQPSPAESFRRWIKQKLAGYPSVVLAIDDEQGLVGVGAHRYHLPEVLANHIVRDVATERDMRLERDLDGASCHSTVGSSQQSVSEDQKRSELDAHDPRQLERRESFRSYLRRALAQLPNGIVTFKTHRRLVEAGELFHGVAPQWIKPTINEVAGEMGSRFISQEQAIEHVSDLIDELIALDTFADGASRSRIYAEGTSWGLDPMDIEAILRRHIERVRLQVAREQQGRRRIFTLFGSIVILVAAVWLWLFLVRPPVATKPARADASEAAEKLAPAVTNGADLSWWDNELQTAATSLCTAHPDLAAVVEQAHTADEAERVEAYSQVIAWCLQPASEQGDRADIQRLLTRWYAGDPSDAAAHQIAECLLAPAQSLDVELPREGHLVRAAFWGCRTAARMWKDPDMPARRNAELGALLETAVGELLDRGLEPTQLENQCVAALARRFYAALPRTAADNPTQTSHVYRALAVETANRMDETTLDRLDVDFLAAVLPTVGVQWEAYRDVVRRVARSHDSSVVLKLLDMLRHTPDPKLRHDLAAALSARLGAAPDSLTEEELIETVRTSVDVTAKEANTQRWEQLAGQVDTVLGRPADEPNHPDVLLQQALDRTHRATLACALAQGEEAAAAFQELHAQGPARLAIHAGPWPEGPTEPFVTPYPVSAAMVVQQHVDALADARLVEGRSTLLRLIANATDTLADIDPDSGQKLAAYLLQPKLDEEHRQLLLHAARLARWNAVRLGLADHIAEAADGDSQRQDVLRSILGQHVPLHTAEDCQRARRQLLEGVLVKLSDAAETGEARLRTIDHGAQTLCDLYAVQAKLLQVPVENYVSAQSPAAVLSAMITHLAGQLDTGRLTSDERRLLDTLPQQLVATDFVAENDLQLTVLRQRIWLRMLGLSIAQRVPAQADAARGIVAETLEGQASEDRAFGQLRDLETGLLRLWMLCHPQEEGTLPGAKDV